MVSQILVRLCSPLNTGTSGLKMVHLCSLAGAHEASFFPALFTRPFFTWSISGQDSKELRLTPRWGPFGVAKHVDFFDLKPLPIKGGTLEKLGGLPLSNRVIHLFRYQYALNLLKVQCMSNSLN
jgi:hypothetical protein